MKMEIKNSRDAEYLIKALEKNDPDIRAKIFAWYTDSDHMVVGSGHVLEYMRTKMKLGDI